MILNRFDASSPHLLHDSGLYCRLSANDSNRQPLTCQLSLMSPMPQRSERAHARALSPAIGEQEHSSSPWRVSEPKTAGGCTRETAAAGLTSRLPGRDLRVARPRSPPRGPADGGQPAARAQGLRGPAGGARPRVRGAAWGRAQAAGARRKGREGRKGRAGPAVSIPF